MVGGKSPIYIPGPVQPQFAPGRMLYFEGFSVDEHGKQHYMDATVAYRQSCLRVIEYLRRFGYSDYQIYLMLSCIPIEGHVAGIVDVRFTDFVLRFRTLNVIDPQRVHHHRPADGHFLLRHLALGRGKEDGSGFLRHGQQVRGPHRRKEGGGLTVLKQQTISASVRGDQIVTPEWTIPK
jgi:hypothetical protein